jgi:hypothetical protein
MTDLHDYFYTLAQQHLNTVDPVPPASNSSPCASGEAQRHHPEPAGSPYLTDWALDTRPTHHLTDAELLDKMRWQLAAMTKRERQLRAFEVPTIYPEAK